MGGIVFQPPQPGRGIHTATAWPQSPGVYQGMGPALTGEADQPDARAATSLQSPSPPRQAPELAGRPAHADRNRVNTIEQTRLV